MVLCKYFLQGACRFGTKCANEHLDIKQLIKSDVESALNGKQWPLSNFGPFKDKPCVPNFIEDQSFEEVRWLCYDAKQRNTLDQFVQQFSKEAMDATSKMNALLQMSPQVVEMVCRLYDAPIDNASVGFAAKGSNPYGMSTSTDAGSIFAKAATTAPNNNPFGSSFGSVVNPNNGGSLFGSNATTSSGLFSSNNTAFSNQQQSSIFGQQMAKQSSIFGGGNSQSSIFGQPQAGGTTGGGLFNPSGNLFSQAAQQQPQSIGGGGLFSQAAQQQQQQTAGTAGNGLFNQAAQQQQTQPTTGGNLFAQAMQQQAQPAAGGNLFAQAMQQQTQPVTGGNLFAQTMQQQQQTQPSAGFGLFSQAAKQTTPVFGQQNPFGQGTQTMQQPNAGIFSQVQQQQQTATGNNLFAQAQAQQGAASGGSPFGHTAATNTTPTQNAFAQPVQQSAPTSVFGQQVSGTAPPPSGFFQSAMQPQPNAQQTSFAQKPVGGVGVQPLLQSPVISSTVYSKLEDLSAEDIEAFQADFFEPGKIPNMPPPRELIN